MLILFAMKKKSLKLKRLYIEMINSKMDIDFYYSTFLA